jgi:thymidylate kinase
MQMDGPQCGTAVSLAPKNSRLLNTLIRQENNYYSLIGQPDLLIVLKVDPEIAVRRKVDETETSVRARSTEVWELDWHQFSAFEVNASLTREEVLSQVKNLLWEHL